ncbi:MarR family winged helix-turn-helix transcriptional regulator [Arthrobacter sp. H5]|uniref:MarR family winged helix-turn-helix transcriptional regulator n=1 Tax=Arthrobacter sp. H5 TaxID=1267973 RepID=UPI0004B7F605|nr:MarR family winged helix-turn-helix transcriptional regulator [Arthrobacter sp. H5]
MDLRNSTVFKLHRATVLVNRVADNYLLAGHGIRYAPFLLLLVVRINGPSKQQSIADSLGVSRASVTQRVQLLSARGLLDVRIHEGDPRSNLVDLTLSGRRLTDAAWHGLETELGRVDRGVDDAVLREQLDRLIDNSTATLASRTVDR